MTDCPNCGGKKDGWVGVLNVANHTAQSLVKWGILIGSIYVMFKLPEMVKNGLRYVGL